MGVLVQTVRYPPAAFVPTDVIGCALWLDGDDATTFTYSSGDLVSQWADKSGSVRHFGNTANYPTRVTGVVNGKAVVRFTRAGATYLHRANFASAFTAGEMFVVVSITTDPPVVYADTGLWKMSGSASNSHFPWVDGIVYDAWGTDVRKDTVNPTPALTSPRLYNVRSASGAWSNHLDGTQLFSTATNTVSFGSADMWIGQSQGTYYLNGDIAEVIMYDNVIAAGDRTKVHDYIAAKYALTIA